MLPSELSIVQTIASSFVNQTTYVALSLFFSLLFYFIIIPLLTDLPHSYKITLSLIIPFALLEPFMTVFFSSFGIQLDWGTYTYNIPFYKEIVTTSFVNLSRLMGFIFDFGTFVYFGVPYFDTFIKTVPQNLFPAVQVTIWNIFPHAFQSPFNMFVLLYVSADTIIDFIFFYYFFAALIVIFSDAFGNDETISTIVAGVIAGMVGYLIYSFLGLELSTVAIIAVVVFLIAVVIFLANEKNASTYALGLALIPVLAYNYFISNPIIEYGEAMPQLQQVYYFFQHADGFSIIMFFGTLLISFLLVMQILATVIEVFYKAGANTFKPTWQAKEWESNYQGIAFVYTAAFAIMYALHQYSWYIFFPALIIYIVFKQYGQTFINTAHEHTERMEMQRGIAEHIEKNMNRDRDNERVRTADGVIDNRGSDAWKYVAGIAVIAVAAWYLGYV